MMADSKEVGFVLEHSSSGEPQTIPGMPGVWEPGKPKSVTELGMSASEARTWLKDRGISVLKEVRVAAPKQGSYDRTAGLISGATLDSSAGEVLPREANRVPGITDAELAERDKFDEERRSRRAGSNVGDLVILPDDRPTAPIEGARLVSEDATEPHVTEGGS